MGERVEEVATSSMSLGHQSLKKQDFSQKVYKSLCSKGTLTFEEKGDQQGSSDGRRKMGSLHTQSGSQRRQAVSRQSTVAAEAGHKRQRSPEGSPGSRHRRNGEHGVKGKGQLWPAQRGRMTTPQCSRADRRRRGGPADATLRPQDSQTKPRSRRRTTSRGRCEENRQEGRNSPKRRRHLSPEAPGPVPAPVPDPVSGLFTHMGALSVALGELCAPGGAFLKGPAGGTEPSPEQRAWLTWQLGHAGAALHWAVATLDAALAAQSLPSGLPPSRPGTHFF